MRINTYPGVALVLILVLLSWSACTGPGSNEELAGLTLARIQKGVQAKLDGVDRDAASAATKLAATGLAGTEARKVLEDLCSKYDFVIDSVAADTEGKMVTVAPDAYRQYEGSDTGKNDVSIKFNQTKKPMLSAMFRVVEGFDAVILVYPIVSQEGDFMGSISVLFKPQTLFDGVAGSILKGTQLKVNAIQLDGSGLYASSPEEAGKNLLTDPRYQPYKELLAVAARIVAEDSGVGSYTFLANAGDKPVKKQAYWATVGLHGTAWRVISIVQIGK